MTEKAVSDMSFEEAMAELERVVGQLESGNVDLEKSIALYERGSALRAHCEKRLKAAFGGAFPHRHRSSGSGGWGKPFAAAPVTPTATTRKVPETLSVSE